MYELITLKVLFNGLKANQNLCIAAHINGLYDFSAFKNGKNYDKFVLNDKYIYSVGILFL